MSLTSGIGGLPDSTESAPLLRATKSTRRGMSPVRWLVVVAALLAVISLVRLLTGANNLTSVGAIQAAITAAVPIALAGLSGLWSERAGVVNIGLEGMMVLGTFGAGWIGWQYGPWAGVVAGVLCGVLGGLLLGLATITFGVDHIIAGVAISIVAPGLALFLAQLLFATAPGGGEQQSPPVSDVYRVTVPGLSDWLGDIAGKGWFFVSDLAGVLGGLTTQLSLLTVLAIVLIVASGFILWRTRLGLRLRSVGEAPYAAESLGIDVIKYKYIGVIVSGALSGLAGAFLVVGLKFVNGQTAGRGFIGLASLIFGNWRPGGMAAGALLFGYTDGVQLFDSSGTAMHAFLLLVAIALAVVALMQLREGNRVVAIVSLVIAAFSIWWFASTDALPGQLVKSAPYAITLLVMGLASQRLRPPKADGMTYRKGGV
ncbi:ABC transporter permease [Nakamurella flavida]|uniref:ABC transporter permease n=1 Tax=Nakamurella flavida TaxID=363630 RepID=A0A938YIX5_9ACTN|nr:ABC transporter permease [Nakamurella flavida]MBM9475959.1 ABC transporter permease [Nakamurella flavida]MBM9478381.1 ABC transporter permease [Nakamurella flavida]MDP9777752.1 simple sugar transport system permease protein [Nakamurella flavida]